MTRGADTIAEMRAEWEALARKWEEVHLMWSDPVSQHFQRQYIDEWHHHVYALFREADGYIDKLDRAVSATSSYWD